MVYSQNTDTSEKGLKRVVRTFVKQTKELIHLEVNGEEIITTPNHPFYVPGKGWTVAGQLYVGSKLLLYNGEEVIVYGVRAEYLHSEVSVYNFEVEDWHTYFISEISLLVHNDCDTTRVGRWMSKAEYNKMITTGKVQAAYRDGATYVVNSASVNAYANQAKPGSIYVEFDISTSSLANTQSGWARVIGSQIVDARLMQSKGIQPPTTMPDAINIQIITSK